MDKVLDEVTPWRWAIDASGRFTYCCPESLHLVGYGPSELMGQHFGLIIDPEDLEGLLQDRTSRADTDGAWGTRTVFRHRNGSPVLVVVSARARTGAEGEYLGLEGTTRSVVSGTTNDGPVDGTRRRVETLIAERLLSTAFQPIRSLQSGQVIGVEALTRFLISPDSPDTHFSAADSVGLGVELEILALETALDAATGLPDHLYVAVNLSPDACLDARVLRVLNPRAGGSFWRSQSVMPSKSTARWRGLWRPCAAPGCGSRSMMPAPGSRPCGTFSISHLT